MMPVISILMPVKNEEQHLEACLASIAVTADQALEVVLVDDHSADATLATARRIAASRNDLSLIVLENVARGKAAALTWPIGMQADRGSFCSPGTIY